MFTGNRGCLVDEGGTVVRHHRGRLWITCVTEYRGWRHPLDRARRWTPIFFLDEAVALAAGHRPCGLCRRQAYLDYRDAATLASRLAEPLTANAINRRLATERLRPGRGLSRAADRILWQTEIGSLPSGTVISAQGIPTLVLEHRLLEFAFAGWIHPRPRPQTGTVEVLTPPTSVRALAHGYQPVLHRTAAG